MRCLCRDTVFLNHTLLNPEETVLQAETEDTHSLSCTINAVVSWISTCQTVTMLLRSEERSAECQPQRVVQERTGFCWAGKKSVWLLMLGLAEEDLYLSTALCSPAFWGCKSLSHHFMSLDQKAQCICSPSTLIFIFSTKKTTFWSKIKRDYFT